MCGTLRLASDDVRKSASQLKEQLENGKTCTLDGCNEPLTMFKGPGDKYLCRAHQKMQREYGEMGRLDRPWTFAREWTCAWCGYNPNEDSWFSQQKWDSEEHKNRAMRAMLVGDHKIRKADGGSDAKDNVQTLCQNCNSKKSTLNHDHKRAKIT
jgi:hypothetical protein